MPGVAPWKHHRPKSKKREERIHYIADRMQNELDENFRHFFVSNVLKHAQVANRKLFIQSVLNPNSPIPTVSGFEDQPINLSKYRGTNSADVDIHEAYNPDTLVNIARLPNNSNHHLNGILFKGEKDPIYLERLVSLSKRKGLSWDAYIVVLKSNDDEVEYVPDEAFAFRLCQIIDHLLNICDSIIISSGGPDGWDTEETTLYAEELFEELEEVMRKHFSNSYFSSEFDRIYDTGLEITRE